MSAKGRSASLLLGFLLAACGSTPSTPTPAASTQPTTSATPAFSPAPTPVASPTSTPDPSPAPTTATPDPSPSPTTAASGLPAGWHHELVCGEDRYSGCGLHLHDAEGQDRAGWPTPLLAGWCGPKNVAVGSDGVAYVACTTDDERTVVSSFAVTGSSRPGWPVRREGLAGDVHVSPDGTVYVAALTGADSRGFSVHAFTPDGHPLPGWPRTLPGAAQGYTLAPDGTVVGWWYEDLVPGTLDTQAARTKFTLIGPDGRTLPGRWPITSIGTATAPVVVQDGSIFYTSETGKVWGHDPRGNIVDGWPYRLPYRVAPELRPDGRLMFILGRFERGDGTTSDSQVVVLTTAGGVASGWPYRTPASIDGSMCCADCGSYYPHASAADGTLYIAPWDEDGAGILALDGRGRVVPGWPHRLPAGSRVVDLELGSAGRIVVTLRDCSTQDACCGSDATRQVSLTPAGEPAP